MIAKSTSTSAFRYCLIAASIALLLLGMIASFNAAVNPFGMYSTPGITGFNANKPAIYSRMRLYKAFEVERVKPQTLILGSSRTHVGIRCSHPALMALDAPCYNLAFDGATVKEIYFYLLHAYAVQPLKHVVLGLDSYHMSQAPAFTRPDFDQLLLYSPNTLHWLKPITADLRLLTSFDMLKASIQTLRSQGHPEAKWFAPDGQRLGDVFFREVQPTFMKDGPRAYFDEIDQQEIRDQSGAPSSKKITEPQPNPDESSLSYIRRIIEFCRGHNIDLRIFITPSHAHQSEISAMLWGDGSLENGKRALVQLLAKDAVLHPTQTPIPLMDFSGYSSITTESLPHIGSRSEMRYYWDSSHFKEIVGDYVLDSLFDTKSHSDPNPYDFGEVLNTSTLDKILLKQREARAAYRKQFADDINALHSLTPGLPILVYHQILNDKPSGAVDYSTSISFKDFESQMLYLHEQGYTTLSMDEVVGYLQGETFPKKIVAIHFDDGWKSEKQAIPVLNRYGFKATFWIIAGAGHDNGSPHMDWDEILSIARNPNFDIYSHTMTHPWREGDILTDWTEGDNPGKVEKAWWELTESKHLLEEKLGRPVPYLAWPRGLYNDTLIRLAENAGYKALLTIDDGINRLGNDLLHINRTMINGACDMNIFAQILKDGKYQNCQLDNITKSVE
jgi:peptidoglycan/xylan/chitin deacetylase (PgdA/CDA1 family)